METKPGRRNVWLRTVGGGPPPSTAPGESRGLSGGVEQIYLSRKFPGCPVGVSAVPSRAQDSYLSLRSNVVLGPITQSDLTYEFLGLI